MTSYNYCLHKGVMINTIPAHSVLPFIIFALFLMFSIIFILFILNIDWFFIADDADTYYIIMYIHKRVSRTV